MAQVKFNRGTRETISGATLTTNEVTFGSMPAGTYDSIYLGNFLVGTTIMGLMKPSEMKTPTYTYGDSTTVSWAEATIGTTFSSGVITTDVITPDGGTATPMTTVRKLVDFATASASGYSALASDSEILTAKAVTALVSSVADNTYYTSGGWNYTPAGGTAAGWNTWTAIDSGTAGAHNFAFTLPIADPTAANYDPSQDTTSLVTPAQVVDFAGANDIYHKTGSWGSSSDWKTYTAAPYKGTTQLTGQDATTYALSFTLPVEDWSTDQGITKHGAAGSEDYYDDHLPTSKAVAKFVESYFASIAGGMRYCGTIGADGALPSGSLAPYKSGDVFIATADVVVSGTKLAEEGDMIIIRTLASGVNSVPAGTIINNSQYIAQYDVYERNLTGAVTAVNNLSTDHMVVGDDGNKTVKSVSYISVDDTNTDLIIAHTNGNETTNVNVAEGLIWHDLVSA